MIIASVFVLLGFLSLIFGANWLVDGASALAKKYNVPDLVIGLTIVALGTSAPELVVNVIASINGYPDIVLGNIIGSNNFNLFIILGLSGLVFPLVVQSSTAWKEIPMAIGAVALVFFMANDFFMSESVAISRVDGIILLVLFVAFLYYVFTQTKNIQSENGNVSYQAKPLWKIWTLILIGLAGLILGGQLVVDNGVKIAQLLGLSEKIIGLTIIAAGTSLPELVTSLVAATKRNTDIAIGNVIGSNIFNLLLILSISSIISPIKYSVNFNVDLLILLFGSLFLLLFMVTGKRKKLDRWEAGSLFVFYITYTVVLVLKEV